MTKEYCTCSEEHELHACPYQEEINEDHEFCCTCCPYCTGECADNI